MSFLHGAIPNFGINATSLATVYDTHHDIWPSGDCGCRDCRDVPELPARDPAKPLAVSVYCGEPSAHHVHNLQLARSELGLTSTLHKDNLAMSWHVVNAAFTESVGEARERACTHARMHAALRQG